MRNMARGRTLKSTKRTNKLKREQTTIDDVIYSFLRSTGRRKARRKIVGSRTGGRTQLPLNKKSGAVLSTVVFLFLYLFFKFSPTIEIETKKKKRITSFIIHEKRNISCFVILVFSSSSSSSFHVTGWGSGGKVVSFPSFPPPIGVM